MINEGENKVVIIGYPASGKSTLSANLEKQYPEYKFYKDVNFINNGYVQGLYDLREQIKKDGGEKIVVEGVMGYRFLRKGLEMNDFKADLIIYVKCSPKTQEIRYRNRDFSKYKHLKGMQSGLDNMWSEFLKKKDYNPRIVVYKT